MDGERHCFGYQTGIRHNHVHKLTVDQTPSKFRKRNKNINKSYSKELNI